MIPRYYMRLAKSGTAIFMSLCLLWTSGNLAQAAVETAPLLAKPLPLPQLELMPPGQFGRVADYFNAPVSGLPLAVRSANRPPPTGNGNLVILIQDLHAHYGVQKNIAGILEFLAQKLAGRTAVRPYTSSLPHPLAFSPPFALAVEGAEGPIDTSVMARFPDQKIKREALDYLMREGELTGMEYFAAMQGIPNLLVGVEDGRYYNVHRELFRKTLENRTKLVEMLRGIQADIHTLRPTVYSQPLTAVQERIDAYDKAEIGTTEFIRYLEGQATATQLQEFPALKSFIQNAGTDANKPEQLRQLTAQFLTQVAERFSPEERATLTALAKKEGTTAYYAYLRDLIYKHELFMTVPLNLAKHLEYLHTAQTTGFDRVTHEAKELAFRTKMQTAQSQTEKNLVQVEHDLALLLKVADLQSTDFEVRAFGPRTNEFVALCHSLLASHGLKTFNETTIRELISTSIDYYVMALMRNKPMVEHTLALIADRREELGVRNKRVSGNFLPPNAYSLSPRVAVLVTGGYHTSMLTQLLRERNVSYVVITPTVDHISEKDHELYIKRLSGIHLTEAEAEEAGRKASLEPTKFNPVSHLFGNRDTLHAGYAGIVGKLFNANIRGRRDDQINVLPQTAGHQSVFRGLAVPAGKKGSFRWRRAWLHRQNEEPSKVADASARMLSGPRRDITIAVEGEGAATHDEVNNQIDEYWALHREGKFPIQMLSFAERVRAAWRIAQAGEWQLALNILIWRTVYLYGTTETQFLVPGQTTHAGISTGAIHLAMGEYLNLLQKEEANAAHFYLAGRIAHEAKEIIRWRLEARRRGLSWRKNGRKVSPMRNWIQLQMQRLGKGGSLDPGDNPEELDKAIHGEGLALERRIAGDEEIGKAVVRPTGPQMSDLGAPNLERRWDRNKLISISSRDVKIVFTALAGMQYHKWGRLDQEHYRQSKIKETLRGIINTAKKAQKPALVQFLEEHKIIGDDEAIRKAVQKLMAEHQSTPRYLPKVARQSQEKALSGFLDRLLTLARLLDSWDEEFTRGYYAKVTPENYGRAIDHLIDRYGREEFVEAVKYVFSMDDYLEYGGHKSLGVPHSHPYGDLINEWSREQEFADDLGTIKDIYGPLGGVIRGGNSTTLFGDIEFWRALAHSHSEIFAELRDYLPSLGPIDARMILKPLPTAWEALQRYFPETYGMLTVPPFGKSVPPAPAALSQTKGSIAVEPQRRKDINISAEGPQDRMKEMHEARATHSDKPQSDLEKVQNRRLGEAKKKIRESVLRNQRFLIVVNRMRAKIASELGATIKQEVSLSPLTSNDVLRRLDELTMEALDNHSLYASAYPSSSRIRLNAKFSITLSAESLQLVLQHEFAHILFATGWPVIVQAMDWRLGRTLARKLAYLSLKVESMPVGDRPKQDILSGLLENAFGDMEKLAMTSAISERCKLEEHAADQVALLMGTGSTTEGLLEHFDAALSSCEPQFLGVRDDATSVVVKFLKDIGVVFHPPHDQRGRVIAVALDEESPTAQPAGTQREPTVPGTEHQRTGDYSLNALYRILIADNPQLVDESFREVFAKVFDKFGPFVRLIKGNRAYVLVTRDQKKVIKIIRNIVTPGKVVADQRLARHAVAYREVTVDIYLRSSGMKEIPTTELFESEASIIIQDYSDGLALGQLPFEVRFAAIAHVDDVLSRARDLLPFVTFDPNPENFRFDKEGNVISWFDTTLPPIPALSETGTIFSWIDAGRGKSHELALLKQFQAQGRPLPLMPLIADSSKPGFDTLEQKDDLNIADIGLEAGPHGEVNAVLDKAFAEGRVEDIGMVDGVHVYKVKGVGQYLTGKQRGHAGVARNAVYIAEGSFDDAFLQHHEIEELKVWQRMALELAGIDVNVEWQKLEDGKKRELADGLRAYLARLPEPAGDAIKQLVQDEADRLASARTDSNTQAANEPLRLPLVLETIRHFLEHIAPIFSRYENIAHPDELQPLIIKAYRFAAARQSEGRRLSEVSKAIDDVLINGIREWRKRLPKGTAPVQPKMPHPPAHFSPEKRELIQLTDDTAQFWENKEVVIKDVEPSDGMLLRFDHRGNPTEFDLSTGHFIEGKARIYQGPVLLIHGWTENGRLMIGGRPANEVIDELAREKGIKKILIAACNPFAGDLGPTSIPVIYATGIIALENGFSTFGHWRTNNGQSVEAIASPSSAAELLAFLRGWQIPSTFFKDAVSPQPGNFLSVNEPDRDSEQSVKPPSSPKVARLIVWLLRLAGIGWAGYGIATRIPHLYSEMAAIHSVISGSIQLSPLVGIIIVLMSTPLADLVVRSLFETAPKPREAAPQGVLGAGLKQRGMLAMIYVMIGAFAYMSRIIEVVIRHPFFNPHGNWLSRFLEGSLVNIGDPIIYTLLALSGFTLAAMTYYAYRLRNDIRDPNKDVSQVGQTLADRIDDSLQRHGWKVALLFTAYYFFGEIALSFPYFQRTHRAFSSTDPSDLLAYVMGFGVYMAIFHGLPALEKKQGAGADQWIDKAVSRYFAWRDRREATSEVDAVSAPAVRTSIPGIVDAGKLNDVESYRFLADPDVAISIEGAAQQEGLHRVILRFTSGDTHQWVLLSLKPFPDGSYFLIGSENITQIMLERQSAGAIPSTSDSVPKNLAQPLAEDDARQNLVNRNVRLLDEQLNQAEQALDDHTRTLLAGLKFAETLPFDQAVVGFQSNRWPVGTWIKIEDRIAPQQLQALAALRNEVALFRIRETNTWIAVQGNESSPSPNEDLPPLWLFDVIVHNHPNQDKPLPGLGDVWVDSLWNIGRLTTEWIIGGEGMTNFSAFGLQDTPENPYLYDPGTTSRMYFETVQRLRNEIRRRVPDHRWATDPETRPIYLEVLSKHKVENEFKTWAELKEAEFPAKTFSLREQLFSPDAKTRWMALDILSQIARARGLNIDEILKTFKQDSHEQVRDSATSYLKNFSVSEPTRSGVNLENRVPEVTMSAAQPLAPTNSPVLTWEGLMKDIADRISPADQPLVAAFFGKTDSDYPLYAHPVDPEPVIRGRLVVKYLYESLYSPQATRDSLSYNLTHGPMFRPSQTALDTLKEKFGESFVDEFLADYSRMGRWGGGLNRLNTEEILQAAAELSAIRAKYKNFLETYTPLKNADPTTAQSRIRIVSRDKPDHADSDIAFMFLTGRWARGWRRLKSAYQNWRSTPETQKPLNADIVGMLTLRAMEQPGVTSAEVVAAEPGTFAPPASYVRPLMDGRPGPHVRIVVNPYEQENPLDLAEDLIHEEAHVERVAEADPLYQRLTRIFGETSRLAYWREEVVVTRYAERTIQERAHHVAENLTDSMHQYNHYLETEHPHVTLRDFTGHLLTFLHKEGRVSSEDLMAVNHAGESIIGTAA